MNLISRIADSTADSREADMVLGEYRALIKEYLERPHRRKVDRIEKAFSLALTAHRGMRRHSGEPYIMHPLAVARIVAEELGLGSSAISAALLHDVPEHTDFTTEDIRKEVGEGVGAMVEGITLISGGLLTGKGIPETRKYRRMLLSMSSDVRALLVKMAERLHNMRTLQWVRPHKQQKVARETLFVFAPLAERLGLGAIKSEFERLAFAYLFPAQNNAIEEALRQLEPQRNHALSVFMKAMQPALGELGIGYEIKSRTKSPYSIYTKMRKKELPLDEIYDIFALRVIFDCDDPEREGEMCHRIASCFMKRYPVHPERMRDWTEHPKPNGYRALHFTCRVPDGKWIEVQIRSRRMHELAELGCAAHWKYKTHDASLPDIEDWLSAIREVLSNPDGQGMDRLGSIRLGQRAEEIYVFTHNGEVVPLKPGTTVGELARSLHPGEKCLGAKVNSRMVPVSHPLSSGDRVQLLTIGPSSAEENES